MNNFEYYKLAFYEREIIKNGNRIKSLMKTNERLNSQNMRLKEQLEILQLKKQGFVGSDRRIRNIGILCDDDQYESKGFLN